MAGATAVTEEKVETKTDDFKYPGGEMRVASDFELAQRFRNISDPLGSEWGRAILEDLQVLRGSDFEREAARFIAQSAMTSITRRGSFLDTFEYDIGQVAKEYGVHAVTFVLSALRKLGEKEGKQ